MYPLLISSTCLYALTFFLGVPFVLSLSPIPISSFEASLRFLLGEAWKKLPKVAWPFSFLSTLTFSVVNTGGKPSIRRFASSNRKISRSRCPLMVGISQFLIQRRHATCQDHHLNGSPAKHRTYFELTFLWANLYLLPVRWVWGSRSVSVSSKVQCQCLALSIKPTSYVFASISAMIPSSSDISFQFKSNTNSAYS